MALDIIVVSIFIISTVRGRRRGFAQTIIKLLAWTAALVLGVAFTKDVAEILMSTPFSTDINNHLTEMTASGTFDISQYVPDFIGGIITSLGVTEPSQDTLHFTNAILNVTAFLLIVGATWLVAAFLIHKMAKKRKTKTVIGRVDSSVGMLLGAVKGVILVFLFPGLDVPSGRRSDAGESSQHQRKPEQFISCRLSLQYQSTYTLHKRPSFLVFAC